MKVLRQHRKIQCANSEQIFEDSFGDFKGAYRDMQPKNRKKCTEKMPEVTHSAMQDELCDVALIRGGTIIDPSVNRLEKGDLFIDNGKISTKLPTKNIKNLKTIDATGLWVVPGLIDLHVHFRDPGLTHKEDIFTGLRAAAAGGFTTVCTMANTLPATDNPKLIKYQLKKAKSAHLGRLLPISAVTKNMAGTELVDIVKNAKAGAVAFSEDGKSVMNELLLTSMLQASKKLDKPVFDHCENPKTGSEETIIARDIELAAQVQARLHICHVSTAESVSIIRKAQKAYPGLITAEAAPHHFTLTDKDMKEPDTNYKMAPPLRSAKDRDAIIKALQDGTISVIATDHAPHSADEKAQEYGKAPNGIIGLETAVGIALTELYHKKKLTENQIISCMTSNPAKILKLPIGTLQQGHTADITIIDPNFEWIVDSKKFVSKSKNMPFEGRELKGKVLYTICGGRIIYQNN